LRCYHKRVQPLLNVRHLSIEFPVKRANSVAVGATGQPEAALATQSLLAVRDLSFSIAPGEVLGLVGESGSGKSITSLAIMRLLPPQARVSGEILFAESGAAARNLPALDDDSIRQLRGSRIAMIFQEPMTALNPVMRVGDQIAEAVSAHHSISKKEAWQRAVDAMNDVAIPEPVRRARDYPHQLSGGMRQRIMIAMAIVNRPQLLIADEPTTALDVTVQAQILALLAELQETMGMAVLLITHDLAIIAAAASRVVVMYGGQAVEEAPVGELFAAAHHPYTEGLLRAVPRPEPHGGRAARLAEIPGSVPPATAWPQGCRFRDRCPFAWDRCRQEMPPLYPISATHASRCHLAAEPGRRIAGGSPR
jgi:peptide/nickel transport system ATP-binding protein